MAERKTPDRGLDRLAAEIRRLRAREQAQRDRLAALQAQRQALEAELTDRLSDILSAPAAATTLEAAAPPPPGPGVAQPPAGISRDLVPGETDRGLGAAPTIQVRGVNYYPARHGWWRMWCQWDPDEIGQELTAAQRMGVNTIRTFLPFSVVEGRPLDQDTNHTCPTDPGIILDRLDQFLDLLNARGMQAILGLLDEAVLLPGLIKQPLAAMTHIDRVMNYITRDGTRLGDDPRILMWDLVNELDDASKITPGSNPPRPLFIQPQFGDDKVKYYPTLQGDPIWPWVPEGLAWLKLIFNHVLFQTTQQITFGVLNPFSAVEIIKRFADPRNIPQYHEYLPYSGDPTAYFNALVERTQIIALRTGRRALIGELGVPSKYLKDGTLWTEDLQRDVTALQVRAAFQNADKILGTLPWVLTDWGFPEAADNEEKYRGLYHADLTPKPAAILVQTFYQTTT